MSIEWFILSILFAISLIILSLIRKTENTKIKSKFDDNEIVMKSHAVKFFGLESERRRLLNRSGTLILSRKGVYYRARFFKNELFIPLKSVKSIRIIKFFKEKPLYTQAVAIYFKKENGSKDTAVFKIPFPDTWLKIIKSLTDQNNDPSLSISETRAEKSVTTS